MQLFMIKLGIFLSSLALGEGPCAARIEYYHVQDMTPASDPFIENMAYSVAAAAAVILKEYPDSTVGFANVWDKVNTSTSCSHNEQSLTRDINLFKESVRTFMLNGTGGGSEYGGQDAWETVWRSSYGPEPGWTNTDSTRSDLPYVKIISLCTADRANYKGDGTPNDAMFPQPPNYSDDYNPADPAMCRAAGYPELDHVAQKILDNNIYLIIFAADTGQMSEDPYTWYSDITTGMNLGNHVQVVKIPLDKANLVPPILDVIEFLACEVVAENSTTATPVFC